jgi:hypothetical protein
VVTAAVTMVAAITAGITVDTMAAITIAIMPRTIIITTITTAAAMAATVVGAEAAGVALVWVA